MRWNGWLPVSTFVFVAAAFVAFLAAPAPAEAQSSCGQIIPNCVYCAGGGQITCQRCVPGYGVTRQGTCQQCSQITPNCTACTEGRCTACAGGFQLQNGQCVDCTAIDPNCKQCSNGVCTGCAGGYGVANGGTSCQACNTINPNCTSCSNGKCTGCSAGFGVAGNGTSCQACSSINVNCSSCNEGTCQTCTNGYAANLAGQCVTAGASGCSYDVGGQCCMCQYDCMGWNPASGSCVGAPMNGCGACMNRQ